MDAYNKGPGGENIGFEALNYKKIRRGNAIF
jgi:hypothetical protein